MGRISDQIRAAIISSGVSSDSLAQSVGISGSVLSKFLSGKQGLTLETIDRLADVLGLEIIKTTQSTPRAKPRGRPKEKTVQTQVKVTAKTLSHLAEIHAKDAHENHFESRRGTWILEEIGDYICVYNNNPYGGGAKMRDDETERFRKRLNEAGFPSVAYATYPEDGYTYAMIVKAPATAERSIAGMLSDSVRETLSPGMPSGEVEMSIQIAEGMALKHAKKK